MFPDGKHFAFTILDDTDDATFDNVKPIYDLLRELGFRTTKTAWPLDCPEGSRLFFAAETLQDDRYRRFVHDLAGDGFELAWHCATMESSQRERTVRGLKYFEKEFGFVPKIHCNHGRNRENIYWGAKRYNTWFFRNLMGLYNRSSGKASWSGDIKGSPYFWGDLCQRHFKFVRNFTFSDINQQKFAPVSPYRLRSTPFVNNWFCSSDAADVHAFKRIVTRESIDRLQHERGVCILSTHLGKGFVKNGRIDPEVEDALRYMAALPGWFAPVSDVLEHFVAESNGNGNGDGIPWSLAWRLDMQHAGDRFRTRFKERKR